MIDVYATTLALGLGSALVAAALGVSRAITGRPGAGPAGVAAAIALLLDAISIAHHWTVGHASDSPAALTPSRFLAEHRAFLVVAVLAAAAWALSLFGGRRRGSG